MKIETKIQKLTQKTIDDKKERLQKELDNKILRDKEQIEKALKLINDGFFYKKNNKKYVIVTEEIFLRDYSKECDNWNKGLKFEYKYSYDYKKQEFKYIHVNGEYYYPIADMFKWLEKEISDKRERVEMLNENLNKVEKDYEETMEEMRGMKQIYLEYYEKNIDKI